MKVEIWYKGDGGPHLVQSVPGEIVTERPGIQSKSGYHLVSIGTDLPKPSVPGVPAPGQVVPRTLLAVRNHYWQQDIGHLGKAVGQLLVSGYVDYARSRNLLQHLAELALACDKLHQELQCMPVDALRRADEEVAGKK